jgi:flagellin
MSSILTNTSALIALQTLKSTNKGLAAAQNEISTGKRVATAKENSSSWSIASTMSSDVSSFKKLGESLTSASAMVGVARTAAEQVAELVKQVQEKVVQAQNPDADRAKLSADALALTATITSIATSAQYNGINLVDGGSAAQTITVSITRSAAGAVSSDTFSTGVADLDAVVTALNATLTAATIGTQAALDTVDGQLDVVNTAAATFGATQIRIDAQSAFLGKQMDALKIGVGAFVDADMEEASARLQALQVQQQLGIQALSIANQAPQNVLALFR